MDESDDSYETVYTVTVFYDGARGGIADFRGAAHVYQFLFDEAHDGEDHGTFLLCPVDEETFRLALEDSAIWKRWEVAFHAGHVNLETHPALPEDRRRHEEVEAMLGQRLELDPAKTVRVRGRFRWEKGEGQVQWTPVVKS